jgi:hypothetical protein
MTFGSYPFGSGSFGSSSDSSGGSSFHVVSVLAVSPTVVEIQLDEPYSINNELQQPYNYSFSNGLSCVSVWLYSSNVIRLITSKQYSSTTYVLTIASGAVLDADLNQLTTRTFSFTGGATPEAAPVVSNLKASTECEGLSVSLSWENPAGVTAVKIFRRKGNHVFDLTDPADVAFNGGPVTEFTDTGLDPQEYYYYTVCCSETLSPPNDILRIADSSRVVGLSIDSRFFAQSLKFVEDNTPEVSLDADTKPAELGGGGGFLDKQNHVLACGIALLRGVAHAVTLNNEPDKIRYDIMLERMRSKGVEPDGGSFDLAAPRRLYKYLTRLLQLRGTTNGVRAFARALTGWSVQTREVGLDNSAQVVGGKCLTTHNGRAEVATRTAAITVAGSVITDAGAGMTTNKWSGGIIRTDVTGDVGFIASNTSTTLTLSSGEVAATITTPASSGATTLLVDSVDQMFAFLNVEIRSGSNKHVAEIQSLGASSFTVYPALPFGVSAGDTVHVQLSTLRREYVGTATLSTVSTDVYRLQISNSFRKWAPHQWVGRMVWVSDQPNPGTILTMTSEFQFTYTATGGPFTSGSKTFSVASSFSGANYAARVPSVKYELRQGSFTTLMRPTSNWARRGSKYDPYNRLRQGKITIYNAWGENDLIVYPPVTAPERLGRVIQVDSDGGLVTSIQMIADSLVGFFLNPNQSQAELFEIIGNTSSKLYVKTDIRSITVPGNFFYVLTARDAARTSRLYSRLNGRIHEFAHADIDSRILFY